MIIHKTGERYADRRAAGDALAEALAHYRGADVLVLGLPRGGVAVAARVADALDAELDVIAVRKLPSPISEELAIGAVTADGERVLNEGLCSELGISDTYLSAITEVQRGEAVKQEAQFRGHRPPARIGGRIVVLVDDGLATGATMRAALASVQRQAPAHVTVAVPVGSRQACEALGPLADEVICLWKPEPFGAVGRFYEKFARTSDDEVRELLQSTSRVVEPW
ncbi:MAG TPA: phosphoribosyltransferase family protein [Gemmatimonadales bacterium]|nr:phosphoribosyltransferase family protein [Gemmatimonadales bacterium]